MLPPPPRGVSNDYDAHILDNQSVQQEAFLGQKRKSKVTSFIKAPCSSLYHTFRAIANDEMFVRFRFNFDAQSEEKFPLQTLLLRMVVKQVYHPTVISWFERLEGCNKDYFPFFLLALCHTIKQKFSLISSNHIH